MMKVLKIAIGLLYDDKTLVGIVLLSMIVAAVCSYFDQVTVGAVVIWLGLIFSLILSVNLELRRKLNTKK